LQTTATREDHTLLSARLIHPNFIRLAATAALLAATSAVAAQPAAADPNDRVEANLRDGQLTVIGTRAADEIVLRLRELAPGTLEVAARGRVVSFDRSTFDRIVVRAGRGDDHVQMDESEGAFTDTEQTTVVGGRGEDRMLGGLGAETFRGGPGDDLVDGNAGNDLGVLGGGEDVFIWDPGDGSDRVEGEGGEDTMLFNGSDAAETFDMSANGERLRFFRNVGNITMDTAGVERVDLRAKGGTDITTINDLSATDVTDVEVDLAGVTTTPDAQTDRVIVNGSDAADAISVDAIAGAVEVSGLAARTAVRNADADLDILEVNGRDGADTFDVADDVESLIGVLTQD
jgi:hypothetical protein